MPPVEDPKRSSLLSLFSFSSDSSSSHNRESSPKRHRTPVDNDEPLLPSAPSSPRKRSKSPKSKSKSKSSHSSPSNTADSSSTSDPSVTTPSAAQQSLPPSSTSELSVTPVPPVPIEPTSVQTDPDLDDLLDFLRFAHSRGSSYNGTIEFKLKYPNESQSSVFVRVHPTDGVTTYYNPPPDGVVSCVASMDRSVFFAVYWGKLHPRNAVLSGRVSVSGWAFRELYNFGCSFDLSGPKWTEYYAWKNVQPPDTPSEFLNSDDASQTVNPATATTTVMQTPDSSSLPGQYDDESASDEPQETEAALLVASPVPDILSAFERVRDALLFSGPTVEYDTLFPPHVTPQPIKLRLRQDTPIHSFIHHWDTRIDASNPIRQAQASFDCPFLDDNLPFSRLPSMRAECGASESLKARSVMRMLRSPSSWVPQLVANSRSKYDGWVQQIKRTDRETLPLESWPSS